MKRTSWMVVGASAIAIVVVVACHKAIIRVERKASSGLEHTVAPEPRLFTYDGHAIALPVLPLANCFDLIRGELHREGPCSSYDFAVDFKGFWSPWPMSGDKKAEKTRHERTACGMKASCDGRRPELCEEAIEHAYEPAWYQRPGDYQRVQASWILDEYFGRVDTKPIQVVDVLPPAKHNNVEYKPLVFATAVPQDGCILVRKVIPADLREECGSYGYPVLTTQTKHLNDPKQLAIAPTQEVRAMAECPYDKREQLTIYKGDQVYIEACPEARTLLSFIHLSDAQIREPKAKLVNREASKELDALVESFEHDYEQELFSPFFYEAVIETINKEIAAANAMQRQIDGAHRDAAKATPPDDATQGARDKTEPVGDALAPDETPTADKVCRAEPAARAAKDTWLPDPYRAAPSFMIHTGDAIDAGLASEFEFFIATTNRLKIPWYQTIGNHDVLAYGNLQLTPKASYKDTDHDELVSTVVDELVKEERIKWPRGNDNESYRQGTQKASFLMERAVPIFLDELHLAQEIDNDEFLARPALEGETAIMKFMRAHCLQTRYGSCWSHRAERDPNIATYPDCYGYRRRLHGFQDCESDATTKNQPNHPNPYYAFVADLVDPEQRETSRASLSINGAERRVWIVVLNTTSPIGAYGAIDERQFRWLDQLLANEADNHVIRRGDLVFMFSHHPIFGIYEDASRRRLEDLIARSGNVIGYFAGHTHSPLLRAVPYTRSTYDPKHKVWKPVPPPAKKSFEHPWGFWEVVAPSTLVFPQHGRQVTVKYLTESKMGYLDIVAFTPQLTENQSYVDRAAEGAARDHCRQKPETCENDRPVGPKQEHMYSRLFFRMPVATTKAGPTCVPMHVNAPTGTLTRCQDPCKDESLAKIGECTPANQTCTVVNGKRTCSPSKDSQWWPMPN